MDDTVLMINSLLDKVRKVTGKYAELKTINSQLESENQQLLQTINEQKEQIRELKRQTEIQLLVNNLSSEEGRSEVQNSIEGLILEIDRCIELIHTQHT